MLQNTDRVLRANIIIALGDLVFRFPNTVEPWTAHIYQRLRDKDTSVRQVGLPCSAAVRPGVLNSCAGADVQNTLMVLTHLILNDMVKVKGQIAEMAMCLVDENKRIADLAHLFFHELARKANTIYNIMPDTISLLTSGPAKVCCVFVLGALRACVRSTSSRSRTSTSASSLPTSSPSSRRAVSRRASS